VIYGGFIVSFGEIIIMLFVITCVLYLWSHAIFPSYIDRVRGSVRSKRRVIKFRHDWVGNRIPSIIEKKAKSRSNNAALYLLSSLVFLLSLLYFEDKGGQKAKEIIEKHVAVEISQGSMVSVVIGKDEKILRYLTCGAKNCAGIEQKSNKIYYFSQSSGHSFSYAQKNVTSASD